MTDTTKSKSVAVRLDTYAKLEKMRKIIVPNAVVSRAQVITMLVNEKAEKLNGKITKNS